MQVRHTLTVTVLAALALSACGPQERYVEPPVSESGVVQWPDYGDFYLEGNKAVRALANLRLDGRDEDADMLWRIAGTPQARWVGDFMGDDRIAIQAESSYREAARAEQISLMVMAGVPGRGCRDVANQDEAREVYRSRVATAVEPLADFDVEVWYIFEPGAVSSLGECVDADFTVEMLNMGIQIMADAGIHLYVDAGTVLSPSAEVMAQRLALLDLDRVAGIAIGTSGFHPEDVERERGDQILELLGQDHLTYVLDTSRNGANNPPPPEVCNPEGQAIGKAPRIMDQGNLKAYVWVKRPGESDGDGCRGGAGSGDFSVQLGLELARNADPANA